MKSHLPLVLTLFFVTTNLYSQFSGGSGTATNPYQITNRADMEALSDSIDNTDNWSKGKYFKLMSDITDSIRTVVGYARNTHKYTYCFQGNFDGNNKKITLALNGKQKIWNGNWVTVTTDYIGLFSGIYEANIHNLTVDGYVKGGGNVGGICGIVYTGSISNCKNYCNVVANQIGGGGIYGEVFYEITVSSCINYGNIYCENSSAGGIGGHSLNLKANSVISNCINYGKVYVANYSDYFMQKCSDVGGVLGCVYGADSIIDCTNYGDVSANWDNVGGIVGKFNGQEVTDNCVTNCINYGTITGSNNCIGGITGFAGYGITISDCRNTGNVEGYSAVGGISGCFGGNVVSRFSHLVNSGNVSGVRGVGGISGHLHYGDTLSYCLNVGTVQGDSIVGGIIGGSDDDNLFYDSTGTIHTIHNAGLVIGNNIVGGIQGRCWGEIHNSLNTGVVAGSTNTGGIAGEVNETAIIQNCYYDKQMCIHGGIVGKDIAGQAEGYLTKELIGNNLIMILGISGAWTFNNANLYPTLKHFENDSVAFVASSPVYLYDSDIADFDKQNRVSTDFKVNLENDVKWNRIVGNVDIVNDDGLLRNNGSDTLVASIGNYKKLVPINIELQPIGDIHFTIWATEHRQVSPTETNYRIPIYIKANAKTLQATTIKKLVIEIDNRIFYAKHSDNGTLASKNQNEITIENIKIPALNAGEEVVLFNLIGDMLLGNIDSSEIIIDQNVEFAGDFNGSSEVTNGSITLNICREGSDRFIGIADKSPSLSIKNNPVEDILEVECNVVESGKYVLEVVDMTGRSVKVEEFVAGSAKENQFYFDIPTGNLSAGNYLLVLNTPTPTGKYSAVFVVKR